MTAGRSAWRPVDYLGRMRDGDIRFALREKLEVDHRGDPSTRVREELGLCLGQTRVDVAVINGSITGYEIKSERDRLDRLHEQVRLYGLVLDQAVLVSGSRHIRRATTLLDDWWGVWHAESDGSTIRIEEVQAPGWNTKHDPYSVAQLLWRAEALDVLRSRGLHRGLASATRFKIWDALVEHIDLDDLRAVVRGALKARQEW